LHCGSVGLGPSILPRPDHRRFVFAGPTCSSGRASASPSLHHIERQLAQEAPPNAPVAIAFVVLRNGSRATLFRLPTREFSGSYHSRQVVGWCQGGRVGGDESQSRSVRNGQLERGSASITAPNPRFDSLAYERWACNGSVRQASALACRKLRMPPVQILWQPANVRFDADMRISCPADQPSNIESRASNTTSPLHSAYPECTSKKGPQIKKEESAAGIN
jgi:hypothetical protein